MEKGGEEAAVNGEGRAGDTGVMLKGMVDKAHHNIGEADKFRKTYE